MEEEKLQSTEGWYSIVPTEEMPQGTNTWEVKIPNVGILTVTLEDKPGGGGYDNKAFVLNSEVPGLAIDGAELNLQGFKILDVSLLPSDQGDQQAAEIRLGGSKSRFESILCTNKKGEPLKPEYWFDANETNEHPNMRDLMVRPERDQLEQIEIRFPEGGDN